MNHFIISTLLFFYTSFYSLSFSTTDGKTISMETFRGKKILLVNIATGSGYAKQLGELEQLQQRFKDSLVVIAFPSNSFGKEVRSSEQIETFCRNTHGVSFLIAKANPVTGAQVQGVYKWLTSQSENGVMDGSVIGDFQKYLVSEQGNLVGVFTAAVAPLGEELTLAVQENYSN